MSRHAFITKRVLGWFKIVHNHVHTDMSSSYKRTVLGLGFRVFTRASLFVLGLVCVFVYFMFVTSIVWLSVPVNRLPGKTRH